MGSVIGFDQGWKLIESVGMNTLKKQFDGIPNSCFTPENYMALYTTVYNMCTQKQSYDFSQRLYDKYRESIEEYIKSTVLPSLRDKNGGSMLLELVKRWENHKIMVRFLSRFFNYLDRFFISRESLPNLVEVGISCFRKLVHSNLILSVHHNPWDAVKSLIDQERQGRQIDKALTQKILVCFEEIGMGLMDYYQHFEAQVMKSTSAYYSNKASSWIGKYSSSDYLLKAEECLKREEDIGYNYLQSSSVPKFMEKVRHELLAVYATQLLENEHSGCRALLRDDKVEDLVRMYRLFFKVPSCPGRIAAIFKKHVVAEGMAMFKQAEDVASNEKVTLMEVIDFHYKYMKYVSDRFTHATPLYNALREAFEVICKKFEPNSSSAELLATFCDNILKRVDTENLSDKSIEETLEKLITCVTDKDLFAEFYRRKLARRFLFDKCVNQDHERIVLSKLKHHFGGQFTSKMEGMFYDMTLAKENQPEFKNYLNSNPNSRTGIDLSVNVLTPPFWPTYKSFDLTLPPEMAKCVESYEDFYQAKAKRRKLNWNYTLGTCYIHGKFDAKTIELIVTTSQAATLLLFNNADRLSYSEIKAQLNLGDEDAVRLLHSLSLGKYKLLKKQPSTDTISPTDNFKVNSKFTDKMKGIKIPLPPSQVTENKVIEDVLKDRRYALEAAIVRIMKSQKVLNHGILVVECIKQMSHTFQPDIKAIKKRIEDLICREYLERDKDDRNVLRYLA